MSENMTDIDIMTKRFEDLDSELNLFLEAVKDIKDIRDEVESLPERLRQNEAELENRKGQINELISSANNMLIGLNKRAQGVIFDVEKRSADLTDEVKSEVDRINNMLEERSSKIEERYKEKHDDLGRVSEEHKNKIKAHEEAINILKNNYMVVSGIFAKLDIAITDMKKNIIELQKRPLETSKKIKDLEGRLEGLTKKIKEGGDSFPWSLIIFLILIFVVAIVAFNLQL